MLEGGLPEPTPSGTKGDGDLFMIAATDPDTITERLVQALRRMSVAYGFDPLTDVQVMTPMRRGPLGTVKLNEVLQEAFNPSPEQRPHPRRFGAATR